MPRPTMDEVRSKLLDAGVAVFLRDLEADKDSALLAQLDFKDVATEAGYTSPGMIYTAWGEVEGRSPRQAFTHDLFLRLVDWGTATNDLQGRFASVLDGDLSLDVAVQQIANASYDAALTEQFSQVFAALAGMPKGNDIRAALAESEIERAAELSEIYREAFEHFSLRLKPGISPMHVALTLHSLELGMTMMVDAAPGVLQDEPNRWRDSDGWTLFSVICYEIILGLTESVDSSG